MTERLRVVSTGRKRSADRLMMLVVDALDDAGVRITPDEQTKVFASVLKLAEERHLVCTAQVRGR